MSTRWTIEQKIRIGTGAYTYRDVEVVLASDYDQLRGELSLAEEGLANATQEIQRLQQDIQELTCGDERYTRLGDDLHRIRNDSLVWAMTCECHCSSCNAMFESIKKCAEHPSTGHDAK